MMSLKNYYRKIISQLKEGKRPRIPLTSGVLKEIEETWKKAFPLTPSSQKKMIPLLCILAHTQTLVDSFDLLFYQTLTSPLVHKDFLLLTIASLNRQILDRCERQGERIPMEMIPPIKKLLTHNDREVFLWGLRIVERMGALGVLLRKEVRNGCPNWWMTIFDTNKRESRQLVAILEKRWSKIK